MSGQNLDNDIKVAIARGIHLFPFRTEKLSLVTPMVLRNSGRVGSRRLEKGESRKREESVERLAPFLLYTLAVVERRRAASYPFEMCRILVNPPLILR